MSPGIRNKVDVENWFADNLPEYHPTVVHNAESGSISIRLDFPCSISFQICESVADIPVVLKEAVGNLRDELDALRDKLEEM